MPHIILTSTVASITELKTNPMATLKSAGGQPIAILNRNEPAFYCVPPQVYEYLLSQVSNVENVEYKATLDEVVTQRVYQSEEDVGLRFDGSLSREDKKAQLLARRKL